MLKMPELHVCITAKYRNLFYYLKICFLKFYISRFLNNKHFTYDLRLLYMFIRLTHILRVLVYIHNQNPLPYIPLKLILHREYWHI